MERVNSELLRQICADKGWDKRVLAARTDNRVDSSTVGRMLQGGHRHREPQIVAVANAVGLTYEELVLRDGDRTPLEERVARLEAAMAAAVGPNWEDGLP